LGAFDSSRWRTFTVENSPLANDKVHAMIVDRRSRIWLGTERGISVVEELSPGQFRWQQFAAGGPGGLPHPWVQTLLAAPDGRIWAGTRGGLAVYDPAKPERGWRSYRANLLRRWTGYLWPHY